jgi:hypothetical protein
MIINTKDSIYNLQLTDDNANVYTFDNNFFYTEDTLDSRSSVIDLAYGNGGIEAADGMVPARRITIEGMLAEYVPAEFELACRALELACRRGGLLSVVGDQVARNIDLRGAKFSPEWKRFAAVRTFSIEFLAAFPYWQDTAYTDDVNVLAGDDSFAVDASGSDDIMTPIITIEADQGVDVPGIKLTNLDDGGMYLEYNNALFVAGSILVIDCGLGTIAMNGNDSRQFLIQGSAYLRLQSMINNFNYEGAACTITISFKRCYL